MSVLDREGAKPCWRERGVEAEELRSNRGLNAVDLAESGRSNTAAESPD